MTKIRIFCTLMLLCSLWTKVLSNCIQTVPQRNQLPMASIFLELEMESACISEKGSLQVQTSNQHSNTTVVTPDRKANLPRMIIDHERSEQTLKLRTGLGSGWDLGLSLRHVKDWEGNWDPPMRTFHEVTGLPYASRKSRQDGEFLYWQYNPEPSDEEFILWINNPQQGVGDRILTLRKAIIIPMEQGNKTLWTTRFVVKQASSNKLPTISSGNTDYGLGALAEGSTIWLDKPLNWLINLGAVSPGDTKHRVYPLRASFFNGGGAISGDLDPNWSTILQTLISSPRYRTHSPEIAGMGTWQAILSLGLSYRMGLHRLMFAFTEDLRANASEDFSLVVSWQGQFQL